MTGVAVSAALLLSIGLLCTRQIGTAAELCALQALVSAVPLAGRTMPAAVLAIALNGVGLPLVISRMGRGTALAVRGNMHVAWVAVLVLLIATSLVFAKVGSAGVVATGVSVAVLGLLLIALRTHPLAPAIGLLSSQSGLVLIAGAQPEPSLVAVVPFTASLVLAENWLRR